jgi:hypothetical protein
MRAGAAAAARRARRSMIVVVQFPDVVLGVQFKSQLGDKLELRLEEIDVIFFVVHQFLEQVA